MTRIGASAALALLLLLLPTRLPRRMEHPSAPPARPALTIVRGRIARNATLATALGRALSPAAIHRLVEAARPAYDLARLSVGHRFGLAIGPDGLLAAFTYAIDELRTLRVVRRADVLVPEVLSRSYEERTERVAGEIASSLFAAVTEAGEQDQLALDLAEILAWDVDFNTELQRGDAFRVAVEKRYLDGRLARYGRILSAELLRGERVLRAVRYEGRRGAGYYAPDGTPLRKAFLRSPLRFSRITSGFSRRRLHPILGRPRPHLGVDYAAPAGTPVAASADGVVVQAGWHGGFGNTVRLRHANGYQTLYGHLSRIRVRPGQRVAQGDTIGAVGSTGLSTGPHLDYRMTRNGAWVDPLRVQLPPAEPLHPDERAAFALVRERALALLDAAPRPMLAAGPSPAAPPPEPAPRL
jgi:murein DD-endopeptidase MepM/ murein hydrolase activator NlpD